MLVVSLDWNKNICGELWGHVIRNLYLIMVIGHGTILAEDKNMFSSIVFHGSLSSESLKDMMPVDKKRTKIYMRVFMF